MGTLLVAGMIALVILVLVSSFRSPRPPQVIYVYTQAEEPSSGGCLPFLIAVIVLVVLFLIIAQ